jgi:hypothetical protein
VTVPLYNLTDTWNDSGTIFNSIKMNITNTASAADSKLLDLQIGGNSYFNITKTSIVSAGRAGTQSGQLVLVGGTGASGMAINTTDDGFTWQISRPDFAGGTRPFIWRNNASTVWLAAGDATTYVSIGAVPGSEDVKIYRDAANVLAQRNGVNAQAFRLYNTFTNASNYERFGVTWSSNVLYLKNENAGTGSARLMVPVTGSITVAGLPSAATAGAGARLFVTDATVTTFLSTVAGGGANKVPVVSDGTNWLIG